MHRINLGIENSGLMINSNGKLTIQASASGHIRLGSDGGLYIDSFNGSGSGTSCDGHTIVERMSGDVIRPTTNQEKTYHVYVQNGGIYQNQRSVQHIYAIGAYRITDHWIDWNESKKIGALTMDVSNIKVGADIANEFNYAQEMMGLPVAPYYLMRGDLLMYKNTANAFYQIADIYKDLEISDVAYSKIFDTEHGKIQTWEDMNRYLVNQNTGSGTKALALFSVDQALYVPMNPRLRNKDSLLLCYLKLTCLWSRLTAMPVGTVLEYNKGIEIPDPTLEPTDDPIIEFEDFDNGWKDVIDDKQHIDENGNPDPYYDPKNNGNKNATIETVNPIRETTPTMYHRQNNSTYITEEIHLNNHDNVVGLVYLATENKLILADIIDNDHLLGNYDDIRDHLRLIGNTITYTSTENGSYTFIFNKDTIFRLIEKPDDIKSGVGVEVKWNAELPSSRNANVLGEFEVVSTKYTQDDLKPSSMTEDEIKLLGNCSQLIADSDNIENKESPTEEELKQVLGDNYDAYIAAYQKNENEKAAGSILDDYHYNFGLPVTSWSPEYDWTTTSPDDAEAGDTSESYYGRKAGTYRSRSGFLSNYTEFMKEIDVREAELSEYILQAHLAATMAGLMDKSGGGVTGGTAGTGGVLDAIVSAVLATKHTGGFVTYCMGGSRTLEMEGTSLHGRIDCTGLIMFVIGLLGWRKYGSKGDTTHKGFSVSNIQSTQMCNTRYVKDLNGNKVSYIQGQDEPLQGADFVILVNPATSDLQAGDFVAYRGHGEIFAIQQDGRCYGWNWGYTEGISKTYKACELARDGTDPLAACVSAGSTVKGKYEVAFRYIGGATGAESIGQNSLLGTAEAGDLNKFVQESGVSVDLNTTSQVVVVKSSGTKCTVMFFEKASGKWTMKNSCNGYVGAKGVTSNPKSGYSGTPKGFWWLGVHGTVTAFGFHPTSDYSAMRMKYMNIGDGATHTWGGSTNIYGGSSSSGEVISKYKTAYEYGCIIEYNYGPAGNHNGTSKGSCFFFHVTTNAPTAGCVAIPKSYMKWAMEWLNGTDSRMLIY